HHLLRFWLNISSFFFQAEDGIRDATVTGVQTCALPISGQLGVAFWSNANAPLDGYVYESLDGSLGVSSTAALTTPAQTVPRGDQIGRASCRGRGLELRDAGTFVRIHSVLTGTYCTNSRI